MKMLRIVGALFGTLLLTVMFSCGGSSYLMEAPLESWDNEDVVVRLHAIGLDPTLSQADISDPANLSKAFFEDGSFSGDGAFDGEGIGDSIAVDCKFLAPIATAIDGGQPGPAAISIVANDPASCTDLRNCCVYTIDADYADPCAIDVKCKLDPDLSDLTNTQLELSFNLRQAMQTNMADNSGLVMTGVTEHDSSGGGDEEIFTISTASINRSDCTDLPGKFELLDDDPWLDVEGQNAPDILTHADFLWNVDSVGNVNASGALADCNLYYEDMMGSISLAPIAASGSVAKNSVLDGYGKICNSKSYTDCGGSLSYEFTLDMYDPAVAGDDLTFAAAGVHHICGDVEAATNNGDDCHPTAGPGNSTCMPYLINNVEPAYDGCLNLCIDYTGIGPPTVGGSTMSDYIVSLGLDSQGPCEANGGVWAEVEVGIFLCLPQQLMACVPPDPDPQYTRDDAYLVPTDEPAAAAMATIFSHGTDADNAGAADFVWNSDKTIYQYMIDCANASKGYALAAIPYERNTNDMPTDPTADDTCINVAQRFVSTTINPGDPGTDKALTPYDLSIVFENFGSTTSQELVIRILDGVATPGGVDAPVFEDISGTYITGDDTGIPAARRTTHDAATQWFDVPDSRVSLQRNPLLAPGTGFEGDRMSVYTDDGLTKNGESWIKVSTFLDFHRINEANLFTPTPENVYLMYIDLMAPIDADGNNALLGCDFWQQFVIDGTCACDVDPDACP